MATYVIENFSNFFNETTLTFHNSETVFVMPTHDDIWYLKRLFSKNNISCDAIKFYTIHEFREHLIAEFGLSHKICTKSMLNLCFEEVANRTDVNSCIQRAIIADKRATLQAFNEILMSGVRYENIFGVNLCEFCEHMKKEIADNDIILEQDLDRLLLKSVSLAHKHIDGQVIFYGFLPFDDAKILMEAAAKYYAWVNAIIYDLGDSEFVQMWINTLEKIFGETKFFLCDDDRKSGQDIKFQAYETIYDEVETTFNQILKLLSQNSLARVGVCFKDNRSVQLPMLVDKLETFGISYCDAIGRHKKPVKHEVILSLWRDWQIGRDVPSFCKFCAELLANNMIEWEQFDQIVSNLPYLQGKCLSDNFDILLEFANIKGIHSFDIVEKYDMHGTKFSLKNFHQKFTEAFGDILPPEMVEILTKQLDGAIAEKIFFKKNLVKYFVEFATSKSRDFTLKPQANVILINVNSAYKQDFTDIFVVGMTAADFDIVGENYWLPTDAIDKINGHAIARSNFGDPIIRCSHNRLLTSQERKYLQQATFEILGKRCKLILSYAVKNYFSDIVEQEPAKIFTEIFRSLRKEFYSKSHRDLLLKPAHNATDCLQPAGLSCEDIESIETCRVSYAMRHDLSQSIHDYCFAIDPRLKLSCSSLEYLLQNPCVEFYDTILKLPTMPWHSKIFDKKVALGSFTHEFIQIFEAKNTFIRKPSPDIFYKNIQLRSNRIKKEMSQACAAADIDVPTDFSRTIELSTIWAKRLVDKLFSIPNWKSFRSEHSLPPDFTIKIKDEELWLSGRLDFIISNGNPYDANRLDTDVVIIDFKTGSNVEMTERNIKWHMERYSGLQLLLYGIALKTLGFKTIKILILKHDSNIANTPIDVDYIIGQVPELMEKISQTIRTGLVERQVLGKTFRQFFIKDVPLATTDLY
ncbi:MAG: PD-(D/E)XK nuclease family protein [Puniceicoccales bacterium]|jgi:hypothetical protein|nr:PD-(D/E)XK nuclease family protein [Puniceicoccales bacterium]